MADLSDPNTSQKAAPTLALCQVSASGTQKPHALLVEPAMTLRSDRERGLTEADYCVTSVCDVRGVFELRLEGPVVLAVLNDLLGSFGLIAAAELVRRQWPHARILIIGTAAPVLQDRLYDEMISHRQEKEGFFGVLQVLKMSSGEQAQIDGYKGYRKIVGPPAESDPTKQTANAESQTTTLRNWPAGFPRLRLAG